MQVKGNSEKQSTEGSKVLHQRGCQTPHLCLVVLSGTPIKLAIGLTNITFSYEQNVVLVS